MQQKPRAREMTQELVAQTGALRGALDQAWNIRDHKTSIVVDAHHAQIGMQSGERIIGHLRLRCRDGANERRFSGVRHSEQANVRQNLQLELEFARFTWHTAGELTRGAVSARFEIEVPAS